MTPAGAFALSGGFGHLPFQSLKAKPTGSYRLRGVAPEFKGFGNPESPFFNPDPFLNPALAKFQLLNSPSGTLPFQAKGRRLRQDLPGPWEICLAHFEGKPVVGIEESLCAKNITNSTDQKEGIPE